MGAPITINGRELNVNDMTVESNAEYIVTAGKPSSPVTVKRTDLKAENAKLRRELDFYKSQVDGVEEERLRLRKRWKEAVAENAKLREECAHWHVEQVHAYSNWEDAHKRAIELEAENAELRKRMEWLEDELRKQGSTSATLMKMAKTYQEDNKKLRDFAKSYLAAVDPDCNLCPYCDPELCDTETNPMSEGCRLWKEMRKLGIEAE